jgi:hypothetical protein
MGENTEMNLKETGWLVCWIDLTQEIEKGQAIADSVKNLWVP